MWQTWIHAADPKTDPMASDLDDGASGTDAWSSQPLFNAVREQGADEGCDGRTPTDTEWALLPCALGQWGDFGPFIQESFAYCKPPSIVGMPGCLHLIADDLYFDIRFTNWTSGGRRGGFAYVRAAIVAPGEACYQQG